MRLAFRISRRLADPSKRSILPSLKGSIGSRTPSRFHQVKSRWKSPRASRVPIEFHDGGDCQRINQRGSGQRGGQWHVSSGIFWPGPMARLDMREIQGSTTLKLLEPIAASGRAGGLGVRTSGETAGLRRRYPEGWATLVRKMTERPEDRPLCRRCERRMVWVTDIRPSRTGPGLRTFLCEDCGTTFCSDLPTFAPPNSGSFNEHA
jgi:hypothetical protein